MKYVSMVDERLHSSGDLWRQHREEGAVAVIHQIPESVIALPEFMPLLICQLIPLIQGHKSSKFQALRKPTDTAAVESCLLVCMVYTRTQSLVTASDASIFRCSDFVYLYYINYKLGVVLIHKQISLSLCDAFNMNTRISHISRSRESICNSKFLQQISQGNMV